MAEFPIARTDRRLPAALLAIGFLLAVNLAVVLFFMLRDSRAPEAAAPATSITASSAVPGAPAAIAPPPTTGNAPEILPTPGDEFAIEPVPTFDGLATDPPDAPDPTLIPDAPLSHPGVTYSEALPGPPESFPAEGGGGLPELSIDLHIFADDPGKRAVFINGRRYVQGARILEGPVVEEITRDGAVLSYHGRRFQLPRL
jgi:hypothetical protein